MRQDVSDPETEALVDRWCNTFTIGNYPLCKSLALAMVRRTSYDRDPDQFLHAHKSLAQSLHFLGDHEAARVVAERVRDYPVEQIATTTVHPRVSMGVLLARIACMKGDRAAARAHMRDITDHARSRNQIGLYQVLALAAIPLAVWSEDAEAAFDAVHELRLLAEGQRHNYWIGWAANAGVAVQTVFGQPWHDSDPEIDFDRLDPKQADHLATMDGRLTSDLARVRALTGQTGWTRIEIMRTQALATSWYDPGRAAVILRSAQHLARDSGVVIWDARLRRTEQEIAARLAPRPRQRPAAPRLHERRNAR